MGLNVHPWLDLAAAFRELDQLENALYCCDNAVRADPRSAQAHHSRGITLVRIGRDDDAREAFRRALTLDPLLTGARFNYATLIGEQAPHEARMHAAVLYRHDPDLAGLLMEKLDRECPA